MSKSPKLSPAARFLKTCFPELCVTFLVSFLFVFQWFHKYTVLLQKLDVSTTLEKDFHRFAVIILFLLVFIIFKRSPLYVILPHYPGNCTGIQPFVLKDYTWTEDVHAQNTFACGELPEKGISFVWLCSWMTSQLKGEASLSWPNLRTILGNDSLVRTAPVLVYEIFGETHQKS